MLASPVEDIFKLKYPLYASCKLDGIRCIMGEGVVLSRTFKPIPNKYIQSILSNILPTGMEGEIFCYRDNDCLPFNDIQSLVMSHDKKEFKFVAWIFDYVSTSLKKPFKERYVELKEACSILSSPYVMFINQYEILSPTQLAILEEGALSQGTEGLMLRDTNAPYKCGRSTLKEGYLLKLKRFIDEEAIVIGYEELLTNVGYREIDNFGLSKTDSKKDNMKRANTLGSLIVKNERGETFKIGTGFSDIVRSHIWANQDGYLGKKLTYKYQAHGMKDVPRCPVFKGFRPELD